MQAIRSSTEFIYTVHGSREYIVEHAFYLLCQGSVLYCLVLKTFSLHDLHPDKYWFLAGVVVRVEHIPVAVLNDRSHAIDNDL